MTNNPILIADIGGTNARFALASDSAPYFNSAQTLSAAEFEHVGDAIQTYLQAHDIKQLQAICLAVAGPIVNEVVSFPNSHWTIDCADLRKRFNVEHAYLLNDWEAIAYSLGNLSDNELTSIGKDWGPIRDDGFTLGALGAGSGLGVSGLVKKNGVLVPLITEGGHAGFSPENKMQNQLLDYLHNKFNDRISRERLLSGPGLVNIHEALCSIHGKNNPGLQAADISIAAIDKTDPLCELSLEIFFEVLGQVAGDIALDMGAYDGVFIGGGICQRYPEQLAASKFREGFENKGRHRFLMENTPTWLITHKNPGLLGASIYSKSISS